MHIACSAILKRIYLGRISKGGQWFVGDTRDVTSEVLQAVIDYVESGHVRTVTVDGKPAYEIEVRAVKPTPAEAAR